MNPVTERKRAAAGLCTACGKVPPTPDRRMCEPCAKARAARHRSYVGGKPWRPGGPGQPPSWARKERSRMEPKCRPRTGAMREEHTWDHDIDVCERCGVKRDHELDALPPKPAPRPVVAPTAPQRTSAARLERALGPAAPAEPEPRLLSLAERQPAKPTPAPVARPVKRTPTPEATEEVATIPDPLVATLAALELERDELEVAIGVLRRQIARKAARA